MAENSLAVHADVLKMAKTEAQRERIKWMHARTVFFRAGRFAQGLALARQCAHEDARFLVSLFPAGAPETTQEAVAVFLAGGDDPRCLWWAAMCGAELRKDAGRRVAEGGCMWALARTKCGDWRRAAQEEPDAMLSVASLVYNVWDSSGDFEEASRMWLRAAQLGDVVGQVEVAMRCCAAGSPEQFQWLRRAAIQNRNRHAGKILTGCVVEQLRLYDEGGSGRVVFEIGAALPAMDAWEEDILSGSAADGERAIELHSRWCAEAKRGVVCWLWLSRILGVAKDIRLLIADLIWDERAAWSERKVRG